MKYLKLYEQINNYKVEVMTSDEFYDFFTKQYGFHSNYDLISKIKYFSWDDMSSIYGSEKHNKSRRFIVAYNNKDILGICLFAWYEFSGGYSISYCSTNNDYYQQGISKKLLEETFKYFSKNCPNEILGFSGYTILGWKYLRKNILYYAEKYSVEIKEKAIEHLGDHPDYELYDKSKKEIKNKYGKDYTDMLGYHIEETSRYNAKP